MPRFLLSITRLYWSSAKGPSSRIRTLLWAIYGEGAEGEIKSFINYANYSATWISTPYHQHFIQYRAHKFSVFDSLCLSYQMETVPRKDDILCRLVKNGLNNKITFK